MLTQLGRRAYPQVAGDGDVRLLYLFGAPGEEIPETDAAPGTDIGALRAGYVSVTPLASGLEAAGEALPFRSFMTRLTEAFPIGAPAGH